MIKLILILPSNLFPLPLRNNVTNRYAGLDHLRALAIIIVFFWHYRQGDCPAWVDTIGLFGWTGVDLFFVLSGYLIGTQILKPIARGGSFSYKEFYFKRSLRVFPAYFTVLLLYLFIPAFHERDGMAPLWKFITFTQNLGLDFGAFSHAWSLCIEEQFYLCLPLIVSLLLYFKLGSKTIWVFLGIFLLGFVLRYFSWQYLVAPFYNAPEQEGFGIAYFKWIYYPTYTRLDALLCGVAIASLFLFKPEIKDRLMQYGNRLLLLSVALIGFAVFICYPLMSFRTAIWGYPLVAVSYGLMVLSALCTSSFLYKYSWKVSRVIAMLSYSIYLTHKQMIHLTREWLSGTSVAPDSNMMFYICALTCFFAGLILYLAIEKPFLKLRDKYLANNKQLSLASEQ